MHSMFAIASLPQPNYRTAGHLPAVPQATGSIRAKPWDVPLPDSPRGEGAEEGSPGKDQASSTGQSAPGDGSHVIDMQDEAPSACWRKLTLCTAAYRRQESCSPFFRAVLLTMVFVNLVGIVAMWTTGADQLDQRVDRTESTLSTVSGTVGDIGSWQLDHDAKLRAVDGRITDINASQHDHGILLDRVHSRLANVTDAQDKHESALHGMMSSLASVSAAQEKHDSALSRLDGVSDSLQSGLTKVQGAHEELASTFSQVQSTLDDFMKKDNLRWLWAIRNDDTQQRAAMRNPGAPSVPVFAVSSPERPEINGKYHLLPQGNGAQGDVWGGGPTGRGWIYMDSNNCWVVSTGKGWSDLAIGQYWTSDNKCSPSRTSPEGLSWWYHDGSNWVRSARTSVNPA
eukprot:TRINITY_DN2284_c0_g1_i1.p1 TRINITY_DN2284_c0_g1~~TRINITY_DN2284_c0_g1_i1.p1  ORF type:complete len:399 (+),score=60.38 TRINITY_DN2284_c0_g1_i1:78-1274(+)